MNETVGKFLVAAGIIIVLAGLAFIYRDSIPFAGFFGKLPGDINIRKEGFSFHFPVVTCILISAIASLVMYILNRLK